MMKTYLCPNCKKKHNIYPGLILPQPEELLTLTEGEKESRLQSFEKFVILDQERVYFEAVIHIDVIDQQSPFFSWKLWVKIERDEFMTGANNLRAGVPATFAGQFKSLLPFYPELQGLMVECQVTIDPAKKDPTVTVNTDSGQLRTDQAAPISMERMIDLMNVIHHPKSESNIEEYAEPFAERLKIELEAMNRNHLLNGRNFCLDLSTNSSVPLQIVSSEMLERHEGENGFGLHLPLDMSFPEHELVLVKFKQLPIAEDFHLHHWDGIPTYQLDCGIDIEKVINSTTIILEQCFDEDVEMVGLDGFEV